MTTETRDFARLFANERRLVMEARHAQAIAKRWSVVVLCLVLALLGRFTGAFSISVGIALGLALVEAGANAVSLLLYRLRRFAPWQFWTALTVDVGVVTGLCLALGPHGYLVLPVVVFGVGGHALGMPSAAFLNLALAVVLYPVGRFAGLSIAGQDPRASAAVVLVETVFLAVMGAMSTVGPVSYTRRLRRVRQTVARMEHGDLTGVGTSRALDDIGFLSVSTHSMARAMSQMVRDIQDGASTLAALSDELAATAQQVQASTEMIGSVTEELARDTEGQRDLVTHGANAMEGLAGAGQAMREEATGSAERARRLAAEAEAQAAAVGRAGEVLGEVGDDYRGLAEAMDALESAGGRVAGFVAAIGEIAERTSLLALNAAIEAARAGEGGRGFAVVADNVRKLAAQSAGAAAEVAAVVEDTQTAIAGVRERLRSGSERLGGVGAVTSGGREALGAMVSGLEQTVRFVEQIAGAIDRQAAALGGVRDDMHRIRQIAAGTLERAQSTAAATQQQSAAMQELTATSQHTAETATGLHELAGRFRVESAAPAS